MKRNRNKNNKDFVSDGYTTEKIIEIIDEIRINYNIANLEQIDDKTIKKIENNYKFFKERYPFLFDMTLKKEIDYTRLKWMLNMRENIIKNNITFENASKEVGQVMYNKYMK